MKASGSSAIGAGFSCKNLNYTLGDKILLQNVDLDLAPGDVASVRGPTGAGKTTLGLVVAGLLPANVKAESIRELPSCWRYLTGELTSSHLSRCQPASYLPQNPLDTFVFPSVFDELTAITNDPAAVSRAIDYVGLPQFTIQQELSQLSGGMLQRLSLARMALVKPSLIVADETHEWLDASGQEILFRLLNDTAQAGGVALVLQSTATDRIPATHQLSMAAGAISSSPSGHLHPDWGDLRRKQYLHKGLEILRVEGLVKSFSVGHSVHRLLRHIDLVGHGGEWLGICGHNGAGKSVLCRILSGLDKEDFGSVSLMGKRTEANERRKQVGYLFQVPQLQLPLPLVGNMLRETVAASDTRRRVAEQLQHICPNLTEQKQVNSLSPYQQRQLVLTILGARAPSILIFDEPTWGCDELEVRRLIDSIEEFMNENRLVIIVSHNERLLDAVCHRTYRLRDGHLEVKE